MSIRDSRTCTAPAGSDTRKSNPYDSCRVRESVRRYAPYNRPYAFELWTRALLERGEANSVVPC